MKNQIMNPFLIDLKWKIFYSFLSFFITFLFCIDSWEYLLHFEMTYLLKWNPKLNHLIYTKISDGQHLIYLLSLYYSFLIVFPFSVLISFIFFLPGMYKKEIYIFCLRFSFFCLIFAFIFMLNHFFIFPILCRDLLQYEYSSLNDYVMNLKVESLISVVDLLKMKIKTFFVICFVLFLIFIIYLLGKKNQGFYKFIIKYRLSLFLILGSALFFFYETEFYLLFVLFLLLFIFFETGIFLLILLYKYKKVR